MKTRRHQILILDDGTYVDAVVGYRTWRCYLEHARAALVSPTIGCTPWVPGEVLEAECRCPRIRIQDDDHRCGIYAYDFPVVPITYRMLGLSGRHAPQTICGEVLLWGDVHVHEKGYRAEFAKPSAFYVSERMDRRLVRVIELAAIQYAVPVVKVGGFPDEALAGDA